MITIRFRRMPSPKGKLAQLPKHATSGAAGADLHANIDEEVTIPPMGRALVPTGLAIELPDRMVRLCLRAAVWRSSTV